MNDFLVYGSILGATVGVLIGYVTGKIQDLYQIDQIKKTYESVIEIKDEDYTRMRDCYKAEINRLNRLLGVEATKQYRSKPSKMSDLVEMALTKDGFEELDFPNGGEK